MSRLGPSMHTEPSYIAPKGHELPEKFHSVFVENYILNQNTCSPCCWQVLISRIHFEG